VETTNILGVLRSWWWLLVLAGVLAGLAGHVSASSLPVEYEARVRMLVGPVSGDANVIRAGESLTRTYNELVTSEGVLAGTAEALGLDLSTDELRGALRPTADSNTRTLIVRVRDLDPDRAVAIANGVAAEMIELTASGEPAGQIRVLDPSTAASSIGIPTLFVVGFAAFAGMVAAVVLAVLLENLRQTIRDPKELMEASGLDYLGSVSSTGRPRVARGFTVELEPDSPRSTGLRMLATKLELRAGREGLHSLLVLGAGGANSSGEVAANLGRCLSDRHYSVGLIDANSEGRELTTLLGLLNRPGLTDLLVRYEQTHDLELRRGTFTFRGHDPRLFILPYGKQNGHRPPPTSGVPWLLSRLRERADFLLVNAAPPDRSAATLVWAGAADGTLLVVKRNRVKREELRDLIDDLRMVGSNPIGVVFEERERLFRGVGSFRNGVASRWRAGLSPSIAPAMTSPSRTNGVATSTSTPSSTVRVAPSDRPGGQPITTAAPAASDGSDGAVKVAGGDPGEDETVQPTGPSSGGVSG
jgi:capsular polysaccharide biosynthesis protein/Mrp family chromosome partitioning ATPase